MIMKGLSAKRLLIVLPLFLLVLGSGILFYIFNSHDVEILRKNYPHLKVQPSGDAEYSFKPSRPAYWASLKEISRYGQWAIVLSEDWSFYQHEGMDLNQVQIALEEMWTENRFRGASTISQQMVKNVFLSEDRTIWRKLNEAILTWKVEKVLSKSQILEIYLNSIEYGPSIYGIRNASRYYFGKSPRNLTPREGAFLAMLLPSPKKYSVSFRRKSLSKFAKKRIQEILEKMRMGKAISKELYASELQQKFSWEK
jgi:monofunctional biosynthetic peptidoglycan transglycosylase